VGSHALILLDTHMWIWFNYGDKRLPARVLTHKEECAISVVSVWELIILLQKGRLKSGLGPAETPKAWLERYPFELLDLDYESVCLSRTLQFEHDDPADRFIAATAFRHGIPLATEDSRLRKLSWLMTF
jgi:PIN domain nuclease of toxin-antitoxin system